MKLILRVFNTVIHRADQILVTIAILISSLSITLLMGITEADFVSSVRTLQVQAIATVIGVVGLYIGTLFDPETLAKLWKVYMPPVIGVMVFTFFYGTERVGTTNKSWIRIGGMSVQPSEFLKIAFILSFAYHLSKIRDNINTPKNLLLLFCHGFLPVGMILVQRDTGVALIMAGIIITMLFVAGISKKLIAVGVLSVPVIVPIVWFGMLSDYQKQRFLTIYEENPDPLGNAYQQLQGLTALGSGEMYGNGILADRRVYVPDNYNDFIFTFLGESLGFIGCTTFLVLFLLLMIRILQIGYQSTSYLNRNICIGVFAMMSLQFIINIGMCLMIMPVIGVTLPLLSAGGSSVLATYIGLALVICVNADNNRSMFSESKHF